MESNNVQPSWVWYKSAPHDIIVPEQDIDANIKSNSVAYILSENWKKGIEWN